MQPPAVRPSGDKTVINWCHIIELTGLIVKQKFVNIQLLLNTFVELT